MYIDTSLRSRRVATYYTIRATFPNGSSIEREESHEPTAVASARSLAEQGVRVSVTRFDLSRDRYDETRIPLLAYVHSPELHSPELNPGNCCHRGGVISRK